MKQSGDSVYGTDIDNKKIRITKKIATNHNFLNTIMVRGS